MGNEHGGRPPIRDMNEVSAAGSAEGAAQQCPGRCDRNFKNQNDEHPKVKVTGCEVYDNLPDGSYEARIENAEYRLSRGGKPMIVYEFVITKGFFANRHVWKYSVVGGGEPRLLEDARRLGIAARDSGEFIKRLPEAKGMAANIALRTSEYKGKPSQFVIIERR